MASEGVGSHQLRRAWPVALVGGVVGRCVAAEEETLQQMARVPQWQAGFWLLHVGLCLLVVGRWLIDGWAAPPFFLSFVFLVKSTNWHYVLPALLQSLRSFCCLLPYSFVGVNPSLVAFPGKFLQNFCQNVTQQLRHSESRQCLCNARCALLARLRLTLFEPLLWCLLVALARLALVLAMPAALTASFAGAFVFASSSSLCWGSRLCLLHVLSVFVLSSFNGRLRGFAPIGKEFFRRLWLSCHCRQGWDDLIAKMAQGPPLRQTNNERKKKQRAPGPINEHATFVSFKCRASRADGER